VTNTIETSRLFAPLQVRQWTFRNRVVMPPMVTCRSITAEDGVEWYRRRAAGGAALVIVEATGVPRFGSELTAPSLRPLVDAVHREGALAAIQLFPVNRGDDHQVDALVDAEIEGIVRAYRLAARVCLDAGFDGVEPHGAHGFLLNRFFSSAHNHRTDKYGGTPENRARLAVEIVRTLRETVKEKMLLLYRHSPVMEPGYGLEESLELTQRLVAEGVDILDLSPSSREGPADLAAPFRRFGVPVIAVGAMDQPSRAAEALREKRADLIAVGRGLIADPDWPRKVRRGQWDAVVGCIKCDLKCFGNLRTGIPIACTQWDEAEFK